MKNWLLIKLRDAIDNIKAKIKNSDSVPKFMYRPKKVFEFKDYK